MSLNQKKIFNLKNISEYSSKDLNNFILENNYDIILLKISKNDIDNELKLEKIHFEFENKESTLLFSLMSNKKQTTFQTLDKYTLEYIDYNPDKTLFNFLSTYYKTQKNIKYISVYENKNLIAIISENSKLFNYTFLYTDSKNIDASIFHESLNAFHQNNSINPLLEIRSSDYILQNKFIDIGYRINETINYFQVNSYLSFSELPILNFSFSISEDQIKEFGNISGDFNLLHFDDEYAKSKNFKGKIAHGLIANSIMSNYFGTKFPGDGTLFLDYKYIFLSPIYPNETYYVTINFPYFKKEKGLYKAIVKIKDSNNKNILISMNTLLKR